MVASPAIARYQWPFITMKDFNGGPDSTAAANSAALASCMDTGLPIVVPPSDTNYKLASPFEMRSGLRMLGYGGRYSRFEAATDFGVGEYLFYANLETIGSQDEAPVLRGIGGKGVGSRVIGAAPCNMDGIALSANMKLEDCVFSYFNSAIKVLGDHIHLMGVNATDSYYSLDFADEATSSGNTIGIGCGFAGALMASIKVGASNGIDASTFIQSHLGFSPIGILRVGASPTGPGINNSEFIGCSFESIGNNAIRDDSTGGTTLTLAGTSFTEVGWSSDAAYRYAGIDHDYTVAARRISDCKIGLSRSPFTASAVSAYNFSENVENTSLLLHLNEDETPPTMTGYAAGVTFTKPSNKEGIYATAKSAVTEREALELTTGVPLEVKRFGTDSRAYFGQALASAALNAIVPVQTKGRAPFINTASGIASGGIPLKPSGVNMVATTANDAEKVGSSSRDVAGSANGEIILQ